MRFPSPSQRLAHPVGSARDGARTAPPTAAALLGEGHRLVACAREHGDRRPAAGGGRGRARRRPCVVAAAARVGRRCGGRGAAVWRRARVSALPAGAGEAAGVRDADRGGTRGPRSRLCGAGAPEVVQPPVPGATRACDRGARPAAGVWCSSAQRAPAHRGAGLGPVRPLLREIARPAARRCVDPRRGAARAPDLVADVGAVRRGARPAERGGRAESATCSCREREPDRRGGQPRWPYEAHRRSVEMVADVVHTRGGRASRGNETASHLWHRWVTYRVRRSDACARARPAGRVAPGGLHVTWARSEAEQFARGRRPAGRTRARALDPMSLLRVEIGNPEWRLIDASRRARTAGDGHPWPWEWCDGCCSGA